MQVLSKIFFISIPLLSLLSCVTFAPPSPLATLGGPKTTPANTSEAAIAVGSAVALFDGGHAGAQGWLGRYKYGINEKVDFGVDYYGAKRNDGQTFGVKIASRYQLNSYSRLELGLGAADDSDGKSLNIDGAYTIGTVKNNSWNYYSSIKLNYGFGFSGNSFTLPGQTRGTDSSAPPNTLINLISVGAQGSISKNQKIIFEGGFGYIFPEGEKSGPTLYILTGLVFNIDNVTK